MSRFRYDNSHNRNRTRIDTRPQGDEAVQAGMRNIHRDTRGNVIGGTTAEGVGIGTKSSRFRSGGGSITPRLDAGPQMPRLDMNMTLDQMRAAAPKSSFANQENAASGAFGKRLSFADQEKAAREKAAASGAFGSKAQNLAGRQSLFRDMQTAGGGAITPDMSKRAAALGVKPSRFRAVASTLNPAPAAIAAVTPPVRLSMTPPPMIAAGPTASPMRQSVATPAPAPESDLMTKAKALRDVGRIVASERPVQLAGPPKSAMATPVAQKPAPTFTPPAAPPVLQPIGDRTQSASTPAPQRPAPTNNPHFPALRSGPTAVPGASRQNQIPSSNPSFPGAKLSQALPKSKIDSRAERDNRSAAEMAEGKLLMAARRARPGASSIENPQSSILKLPSPMPPFGSPFLAIPAGDRVRSNGLAIAIPDLS